MRVLQFIWRTVNVVLITLGLLALAYLAALGLVVGLVWLWMRLAA